MNSSREINRIDFLIPVLTDYLLIQFDPLTKKTTG